MDRVKENRSTSQRAIVFPLLLPTAHAADKPNILFIMTDDVGLQNIGAYHRGLMSSQTPNLDRIAEQGALYTDYYAEPTHPAGRSATILPRITVRRF